MKTIKTCMCGDCPYWRGFGWDKDEARYIEGFCVRHAPVAHPVVLNSEDPDQDPDIWPRTYVEDVCGEHSAFDPQAFAAEAESRSARMRLAYPATPRPNPVVPCEVLIKEFEFSQ